MKKIKIFLLMLMILLQPLQQAGCAKEPETVSKSGFFFDTIVTITLYGTDDAALIDDCFALAQRYERLFSATVTGSDIWKINHSSGKPVKVDPETLELIKTGCQYGKLSGGKFDITIGKLSELWNISEIAEDIDNEDNETTASVLPKEEAVKALLPHIDYRKVSIDGEQVCLKDPETALDLGGIAKGYIADRMKALLSGKGIGSGIIDLGRNVLTIGEKADGSDYRIGVQKPFGENGELLGVIHAKDKSVVTSGIYERYFRVNGRLYHHILDTATGYPYDNGLMQVTIISDRSADGDALSTACFALGLEKGLALIETLPDTEAVFVDKDLKTHFSSGAEAFYDADSKN